MYLNYYNSRDINHTLPHNLDITMDFTFLPILLLAAPSTISPLHIHTALNGRPSYVDSFHFCLGMQTPLAPNSLKNEGDSPTCADMKTGRVFRIENQATVMYLQKMQQKGRLQTLEVGHGWSPKKQKSQMYASVVALGGFLSGGGGPGIDGYLILTILTLLLSRVLSITSIRARTGTETTTSTSRHKSASEPDVQAQGDLLIRLSEDEDDWIRLKGAADDLKAVTSGKWLSHRPRHPQLVDAMDWTARMLVYVAVVVLANACDRAKVVMVVSSLLANGWMAMANALSKELVVDERVVKISEQPRSVKEYSSQRGLAEALVREAGRKDFAVSLGMINPEQAGT